MKGYIYICEMVYKGEFYYKIGRALNVVKREADLKIGNPFLSVIAITQSANYITAERKIQNSVAEYHFSGEWYRLTLERYRHLYTEFAFKDFTDDERQYQQKFGHTTQKTRKASFDGSHVCHVFKKPKKLRSGERGYRWYYYYVDENGKQHQKSCRGCTSRKEAEDYIRALKKQQEEAQH
jgi:hypothetical protein